LGVIKATLNQVADRFINREEIDLRAGRENKIFTRKSIAKIGCLFFLSRGAKKDIIVFKYGIYLGL